MRPSLFVLALTAAALTACPIRPCAYSNVSEGPCYGGCACGGGCSCDWKGEPMCTAAADCMPTCLDDAGTPHYPGNRWSPPGETCTCDYGGNIRCCPMDAGSCTVACAASDGELHQVGEQWIGVDGGSCTCREGFVVDCGAPPTPAHCSFAGRGYNEGDTVDAGAACACTCASSGHVRCPAQACLPTSCTYQAASYPVGLVFTSGSCNVCLCGDDGVAACTERVCSGGKCEYQGTVYDAGSSFASADGCNTCTCQASGSTSCTTQPCGTVHCVVDGGAVAVGTTFFTEDRCNLCGCSSDGKVYCTQRPCTP